MSFAPFTRMLLVKVTSREPSFSKPLTYIPSVTSSMDIFLITQTLRMPLGTAFSSGSFPITAITYKNYRHTAPISKANI